MCKFLRTMFCPQKKESQITLEDFVSTSITQIFNGIKTVQEEIIRNPYPEQEKKYFTPYVNPQPTGGRKDEIYELKFDIAVTVTTASSSSQGFKSEIYVVKGNVENSTSQSVSSISRIQFSIPIVYPSMPLPHPGNEK